MIIKLTYFLFIYLLDSENEIGSKYIKNITINSMRYIKSLFFFLFENTPGEEKCFRVIAYQYQYPKKKKLKIKQLFKGFLSKFCFIKILQSRIAAKS